MKTISIIIFLSLIMLVNTLNAQQIKKNIPRQGIYVEFFGSSTSFFSFNYDRFLSEKWTARSGLGFSFDFSEEEVLSGIAREEIRNQDYIISLPVTISRLFGNGEKFFELSPGGTLLFVSEKLNVTSRSSHFEFVPALYAGYRRQPSDGGFLFRVGMSVVYSDEEIFTLAGLSFGYSFKP